MSRYQASGYRQWKKAASSIFPFPTACIQKPSAKTPLHLKADKKMCLSITKELTEKRKTCSQKAFHPCGHIQPTGDLHLDTQILTECAPVWSQHPDRKVCGRCPRVRLHRRSWQWACLCSLRSAAERRGRGARTVGAHACPHPSFDRLSRGCHMPKAPENTSI